jgi:hypothetical protein
VATSSRARAASTAIAVALAALAACVAAATAPAPGEAAPAKPTWHVVPGVRFDPGDLPRVLGWASGRAWIGFSSGGRPLTLTSARPAGGTLQDFTRAEPTRVNDSGALPIVGSELAFQLESLRLRDPQLRSVSLLANGRLGPPAEVPGEPGTAVQGLSYLTLSAGAKIGDRNVFAFVGGDSVNINKTLAVLVVCCTTEGAPVDLTRLIDRRYVDSAYMGVDDRGRLWVGWREKNGVQLVELDKTTLLPRTRPHTSPGGVERWKIACGALCRVVATRYDDDAHRIVSWAPGERRWTTVPVRNATFLAATYRSGRLEVAYWAADGPDYEIQVARGDARGARAKVVASIVIPDLSAGPPRPTFWMPFGYAATFVPGGAVAVVLWEKNGSPNGETRATAAYLGR